jgi:hypothetical protein
MSVIRDSRIQNILGTSSGVMVAGAAAALGAVFPFALGLGLLTSLGMSGWMIRRERDHQATLRAVVERLRELDARPIEIPSSGPSGRLITEWNDRWRSLCETIEMAKALIRQVHALPHRVDETFGEVVGAADRQEAAVEETASLVANMRQSMESQITPLPFTRSSNPLRLLFTK